MTPPPESGRLLSVELLLISPWAIEPGAFGFIAGPVTGMAVPPCTPSSSLSSSKPGMGSLLGSGIVFLLVRLSVLPNDGLDHINPLHFVNRIGYRGIFGIAQCV